MPTSEFINPVEEITIKGIPDVPNVQSHNDLKPAVFMSGGRQIEVQRTSRVR